MRRPQRLRSRVIGYLRFVAGHRRNWPCNHPISTLCRACWPCAMDIYIRTIREHRLSRAYFMPVPAHKGRSITVFQRRSLRSSHSMTVHSGLSFLSSRRNLSVVLRRSDRYSAEYATKRVLPFMDSRESAS